LHAGFLDNAEGVSLKFKVPNPDIEALFTGTFEKCAGCSSNMSAMKELDVAYV
jgi:hypothetical protein